MEAASDKPARIRTPSSHRITATVLVVLGTIVTFLAIAAIWVNRQALDTDNWTDASSQMLENKAIRTALSGFLVDQLYANVDVAGEIRSALPPRAQPLAAPAAGAVRDLAERASNELLQRPRVQALWEQANRTAHERFLQTVKGGGPAVSTANGVVTIDLATMLQQLANRTGVGGDVASKIPPGSAQITVLRSNQLSFAQDLINALRPLAIFFVALALALYAGAIALSHGRRRETLRAAGFGFIVAGVLALLVRSVGGGAVVGALAKTEAARPPVESVWQIGTSLLVEAATAAILYGVFTVVGTWLAGPTRAATGSRRGLAPYLRDPRWAWGGAVAIILLIIAWGPTPGTRHFVPMLVLTGLFALGVEALRRQTAREFPDAVMPDHGAALEAAWGRVRGTRSKAPAAATVPASPQGREATSIDDADMLVRLERLANLHDRGALTDAEFADQKQELLTAH